MHFAARSALLASCLAISVHALPVTYSVVDVDGGSAANGGGGATDQPATVYHTVTKSTEAEEPEATTVSVSVTIVETKPASVKSADVSSSTSSSASSSTSSSSPSQKASAQASSSSPAPSATATDTLDASSVLQSASSTFSTHHTSNASTPSAKPTITQAPPAASASHASQSESSEDCDAASVTVTADVPDAEQTVAITKGNTVVLFSTTTVTPAAESTSYYDDGMWHTRYAIKPAPSPEAEKPSPKDDGAASKFEKSSESNEKKQLHADQGVATNTTSEVANSAGHARREVDNIASTPTAPATPSGSGAEASGAPLMFIQPLLPRATGIAARAVPTGGVAAAAASGVLTADEVPVSENVARRAPSYSVVSWNETMQA